MPSKLGTAKEALDEENNEGRSILGMKVESSNSKYQTKTLYINNPVMFLELFHQLVLLSPPWVLNVET